MTKAPATIIYASVVSRETVTIALMVAALNDLEVKFGDNLNAYIQVPVTERCGFYWVLSLIKMSVRLQLLLEHYMT